jgi:choline kinase
MAKLTALVMAAGFGSRMGDATKNTPKPLLKINDRAIIDYDISFLKNIGVDRIVVVGGYMFEELEREVGKIDKDVEVVKNDLYEKGNIFSLKCGLDRIESGSFMLYHADHIYRKDIAGKIKNQLKDDILIFTDNDRELTNDDMKVKLSNKQTLRRVSKKIDDFELGYVGITYCPEKCLDYYKKVLELVIDEKEDQAVSEDIMQHIADKGKIDIRIGNISGSRWHEVDDKDDYKKAVKFIGEEYERYF